MGRRLPSATKIIIQEEAAFGRFRRALRRQGHRRVTRVTRTAGAGLKPAQLVALDELFSAAKQHTAAAQDAAHALPLEVMMLSMLSLALHSAETADAGWMPARLVEEHKEVMRLRELVEALKSKLASPENGNMTIQQTSKSGLVDPGFGFDDDPKIEEENSHADEHIGRAPVNAHQGGRDLTDQ
jgi:hypothetical protein